MPSANSQTSSAKRAQEVAYGWLKRRVEETRRDETVFLTEAEVSSAVGVSRTPVREALQRLHAEHLIELVAGKGGLYPPDHRCTGASRHGGAPSR